VSIALRLAAAVGVIVAAAALLHGVVAVPESDMSASRVVPAVALARGFPLYAGPASGPIIDFMYGPIAALAFLPAALASTPSGALAIAVVVNVAWFFLPMAWLHVRAAGRLDVGLAALVLFALVVLRDPGLTFSALTIHADAPALGLGAVACVLAAGGAGPAAIALATALALWTKQTMAPIALALLVHAWARGGRRGALRLAAWLGVFGLGIGVLACLAFGPAALVFNMVTLPGRMPWYGDATTSRWATALFVAGLVVRLTWLPALVTIGLVLRQRRRHASTRSDLILLAGAALALAPAAIAGGAKVGGYLNTLSVTSYFLVAAATAGLAAAARDGDRVARVLLVAGLVGYGLVLGTGPAGVRSLQASVAGLRAWTDNPHERAFRAARAHPGEIDFPWDPLAVVLAENRLDNNEIGAWNRDLAGVPIDDALWRRHLPPRLRWMAFRPPTGAFTWLPEPTGRLPELSAPASLPGLEGFTVLGAVAGHSATGLERDPHGAAPPPHP